MNTNDRIKFRCVCGKRLSVPKGSEGRKARCPLCQTVLVVPGGPEDESSIITPASPVTGSIIVAEYSLERTLDMRGFLARKGFDVRTATEGYGLRLMVIEDMPDAIILACDLPNMETATHWQQLREATLVSTKPPVIIVLSGPDTDVPPVKVDAVVPRDISRRDLLDLVEQRLVARDEGQ